MFKRSEEPRTQRKEAGLHVSPDVSPGARNAQCLPRERRDGGCVNSRLCRPFSRMDTWLVRVGLHCADAAK